MEEGLSQQEIKYLEEHGINSREGLLYCDSAKTYHLIMEMFCEGGQERAETIQKSLDNDQWENYLLQVHSLKSTAKSVGADELSIRAKELEFATRNEQYEVIYEKNKDLLCKLHETVEIFNGCLMKWGIS